MKSKIIAVVGPTASGKSGLAVELAKKYNGEILCVDSRTVYRGMDVGTAKPSIPPFVYTSPLSPPLSFVSERGVLVEGIRHFGLDLIEPNQEYNGALFKEYAEKVIADMVSRGKLPILVGGTGLWMDMIIDNIESPEVEPDFVLRAELEKRSVDDLFSEYQKLDPAGAAAIDKKNKRRLVRAIEVCQKTNQPFSALRQKGEEKYDALWLGIVVEKNTLNERIDHRVDEMMENGLLEEVKQLIKKYGCDVYSMSGIGYQEFCCRPCLTDMDIVEAVNEIKIHTRQYAKRQMAWFKRNKRIKWIKDLSEAEKAIES